MHDLDRIASRYRELRGKPVEKTSESLLNRIEAYQEILDDLSDMRERKETVAARKRVMGRAKRLESKLIGECAECGLDLGEQLARFSQAKQSGPPGNYVPSRAGSASSVRLSDNSRAR